GALVGQRLGDAPGNRVLVGDAHDQALLACHQSIRHRSKSLLFGLAAFGTGGRRGASCACVRQAAGYGPRMSKSASIADDLSSLVGAGAVVSDPTQMGAYLMEPRKRFHTPAAAVVRPGSVAEVQAIVRWANDRRVGIIPQGGNTGLV